jgi:hypothetical protein
MLEATDINPKISFVCQTDEQEEKRRFLIFLKNAEANRDRGIAVLAA